MQVTVTIFISLCFVIKWISAKHQKEENTAPLKCIALVCFHNINVLLNCYQSKILCFENTRYLITAKSDFYNQLCPVICKDMVPAITVLRVTKIWTASPCSHPSPRPFLRGACGWLRWHCESTLLQGVEYSLNWKIVHTTGRKILWPIIKSSSFLPL